MLVTETWPIYSVTATERSFVLGIIRFEKRAYINMLVQKVVGQKLPTEIKEEIEDYLFPCYWKKTRQSWERTDELWRNHHPALHWERYMSKSALAVWCKLAEEFGLALVAREGPYDRELHESWQQNIMTGKPYLVHIGRSGQYSHGALKHTETTGREYSQARLSSGTCWIGEHVGRGSYMMKYGPACNRKLVPWRDRVDRFLELEGLEDEIRRWDDEAVRSCVKLLDLEMVRRGEKDPMKPSLRIVQSFVGENLPESK